MRQAAFLFVLSAALAACATAREERGLRLRIDLGYGQRRALAVLPREPPAAPPGSGKRRSVARVAGGSCEIAVIADETTERMQLAHCGGEVSYDLPKVREHLEWTGFAAPVRTSQRKDAIGSLRVRDRETDGVSRRQIAGTLRITSLAPMPVGELAVDVGIEPARLRGQVAGEVYDLVAEGDSYVGTVLLGGQPSRFTIMGRAALWRMPAADQAALLPLVLGCAHAARRGSQTPIPSVDFTSLGEE